MWERFVERKIRHLFVSEGTERRREETKIENFYHAFLYDVLQDTKPQEEKMVTLNHSKAKLIRLYSTKLARGNIDTHNLDKLHGERVCLSPSKTTDAEGAKDNHQCARPGQAHTDVNEGHCERLQRLPSA